MGAGAFLGVPNADRPGGAGPANLRLDGKEAAYASYHADRYDRASCRDHGAYPYNAETTEVKDKPRIGKPVRGPFYRIHPKGCESTGPTVRGIRLMSPPVPPPRAVGGRRSRHRDKFGGGLSRADFQPDPLGLSGQDAVRKSAAEK